MPSSASAASASAASRRSSSSVAQHSNHTQQTLHVSPTTTTNANTASTANTVAWPSQTIPRLRKRKTIKRRHLPKACRRICPSSISPVVSPVIMILGCFVMLWCAVVLVAFGTIGGGLARLGGNDGGDGGVDGDVFNNGGDRGRDMKLVSRHRERTNSRRNSKNPLGDAAERKQRLRGGTGLGALSATDAINADDSRAIPKSPYAYEGWQPLPPSIPPSIHHQCSWRQCLDPSGKAAGSRLTPLCKSYCREDLADLEPVPPVPTSTIAGSNNNNGNNGNGNNKGESASTPWIPDVEIVRRMYQRGIDANGNVFPPPLDKELCEPMGPRGQSNVDINRDMLDAVKIRISSEEKEGEEGEQEAAAKKRPKTRILCMVYTMADAHPHRIRAIRETWAGKCDGFLAFSTANDPRIPAISLDHEGPEAYGNMWQKVRSIWKFVGEHYVDTGDDDEQTTTNGRQYFDYFFLGGDDLFVVPENLRSYLSTLGSPDDDHFVGRRFKGYGTDNYFNSGGAGYALSRGLVKKYYQVLDNPGCSPHQKTSMEDVNTAACLRKVLGVGLTDTRDERGRERFHPFAPGTHYTYKPGADRNMAWYEDYNREWGILPGTDCCAPDSVSFHYIKKAATVRHIYKLLYDSEDCQS